LETSLSETNYDHENYSVLLNSYEKEKEQLDRLIAAWEALLSDQWYFLRFLLFSRFTFLRSRFSCFRIGLAWCLKWFWYAFLAILRFFRFSFSYSFHCCFWKRASELLDSLVLLQATKNPRKTNTLRSTPLRTIRIISLPLSHAHTKFMVLSYRSFGTWMSKKQSKPRT